MTTEVLHAAANSGSCSLAISGMDCGDCAQTIEASLNRMDGVTSANVNFGLGSASVQFDPNAVSEAMLRRRIQSLGYDARPHKATAAEDSWIYDIQGMDCGDCARTIETGVRQLPGVGDVTVNFGSGTMTVVPGDSRLTRRSVVAAVSAAGYQATPREARANASADPAWWRKRRVREIGVATLLWIVGFVFHQRDASTWQSAIPYLGSMLLAGYPVARAGWFAAKARRPDMNLLMTIAAVGAIAIGEWEEGSSVLILFAIGLTLQSLTLDRTRRAIQSLLRLAPREATVIRDSEQVRIPVDQVKVGETVIVLPGEQIPVDGRVVSGFSVVDQSSITGESVPVQIEPGGTVFAASINGDGALQVESIRPADDTTFAKIIHMVEEAQGSKAPAQAFVDRFAASYTPIVVAIALCLATVVPLVVGDWRDWIFRALVLLVVACPCALVISTPVAMVAAIGSASKRGVLFKGGSAIETLAGVRTIAFDKTGTLTAGRPTVVDVIPFGARTTATVLASAAAVERGSTHPIATSIVEEARRQGVTGPEAVRAETIPGKGARALVGDEIVLVGNTRLFPQQPSDIRAVIEQLELAGKTVVLVGSDAGASGVIAVSDAIRPTTMAAISALRRLDLATVMLTGDNRVTADRIATQAGVPKVRAELLPADKVAAIRALQASGAVAMIGDGVNDAPALATADVGIAMGVAGSDAAIQAADVALMGDDLSQLPVAVRLARSTLTIIRQNIVAALLVKAVFLGLTFFGVTNLWLAVLADTGMSLLVTGNSLRLLQYGFRRGGAPLRAAPHHAPAGD